MLNKEALKDLEEARLEYEKRVADVLSRYGESSEPPRTTSDIPLKAAYTPKDLEGFDYLQDLGFPGEYPYTRGIAPLGYRTRAWTVRQVMGVGTAEETNQRLKYLIEHRHEAVSRSDILDHLWDDPGSVFPRTVDTHIATLRRKLEDDPAAPRHLIQVRGVGYRFAE